jgi:hypothetical protein
VLELHLVQMTSGIQTPEPRVRDEEKGRNVFGEAGAQKGKGI